MGPSALNMNEIQLREQVKNGILNYHFWKKLNDILQRKKKKKERKKEKKRPYLFSQIYDSHIHIFVPLKDDHIFVWFHMWTMFIEEIYMCVYIYIFDR